MDMNSRIVSLEQELTPSVCPSLMGKPKMVFLQTCQGREIEIDSGATVTARKRHTSHDGAGGDSKSYVIPQYADFLIFQVNINFIILIA